MKPQIKCDLVAALVIACGVCLAATAQTGQRAKRHASLPVATRDGKRIVFSSDREGRSQIYTMNADGTDERRVTDSPNYDFGPDWSPDGKWIVFCSFAGDNVPAALASVRADGSGRKNLLTAREISWPRISPDGRRIAFRGGKTIFIVNSDGTHLRPFPTGLAEAWDPEWSPDRRQILFGAFPDSTHPSSATSPIYVADVSGKNRHLVATYPGVIQLPRWSPDGRSVAFQTYTGGADANIVILDIASGNFRTITLHDHPYLDETPSWLPDGRLLFQSNRDGAFEIYRMNADGSSQQRISPP